MAGLGKAVAMETDKRIKRTIQKANQRYRRRHRYKMQRLRRQLPFLRSVLQEANRLKRQDLLQHANADQINAVSELALNFLKNKIPVTPPILAKLRPYKKVLRDLGRRRHSVKKRRQWLVQQKGRGLFQGLHRVFCQCARPTR